jgi:hypothetical protein
MLHVGQAVAVAGAVAVLLLVLVQPNAVQSVWILRTGNVRLVVRRWCAARQQMLAAGTEY